MKKIILFVLIVFIFFSTSCSKDTTQEAKNEFTKYYNGNNEVVLIFNDTLYFEQYEINLNNLIENEEFNNGLIINDSYFYFTTSKQNSSFNYIFNIYKYDILNKDIKLIFSKSDFKTHPWAYANNNEIYVEYFTDNSLNLKSKKIDKYTILSNVYENIGNGKDCNLSDYIQEEISQYNIEVTRKKSPKEHGEFIVTDSKTGIKKIIDDEYLKNTIYIESMNKYNYEPLRYDISKGHILLTYEIGAGDGWNHPHLVFEYNYETNTLEYKMLVFPYDSVPIEIVYIK